jgi:two-component system, LytTR family, response regulator
MLKKGIKRILIQLDNSMQFLSVEEIIHFESKGSHTTIFLTNQSSYLLKKNIGTIEKALEQYTFSRVHHSYLVNTQYISKFLSGKDLLLKNGAVIPVSRRNKHKVVDDYDKF